MGTRQEFRLTCSAEEAFDGFTDGEEIKRWWRDANVYRTVSWDSELNEGGSWRAEFEAQEGSRFGAGGKYVALARPSRLEWTWRADWEPDLEKTITIAFEPTRGGCRMTVETRGHATSEQERADEEAWSMIVGWFQRTKQATMRASGR